MRTIYDPSLKATVTLEDTNRVRGLSADGTRLKANKQCLVTFKVHPDDEKCCCE